MKEQLTIIKVGGKIVEDAKRLQQLLNDFSQLTGHKLLVHGGGRLATQMATQLGIESKMITGRRITDEATLRVVTMVYAGLVNKNIVAQLQKLGINAIGLTGADMNVIQAQKRPIETIDYGFVGDVNKVNEKALKECLKQKIVPVMSPLSHDGEGNLLNTNADTIASEIAKALSPHFKVKLIYCFEKKGVLLNPEDDDSVLSRLNRKEIEKYIQQGVIKDGMLPKIENALKAVECGVEQVVITSADSFLCDSGTTIQ